MKVTWQRVVVQTESIGFISIAQSLEFCGCLLIIITTGNISHAYASLHVCMNDRYTVHGIMERPSRETAYARTLESP